MDEVDKTLKKMESQLGILKTINNTLKKCKNNAGETNNILGVNV